MARRRRREAGPGSDRSGSGLPNEQSRDPEAVAREVALRQLSLAPRTRAQLSQALARHGVADEVAEPLLDRFEDVSLVDDAEFARMWVQSRHTGRGLARRALSYELRQRGVAEDVVREAVDRLSSEDELAAARALVRRRLPALRGDDPARRIRRLAGMLARKGYAQAVSMQAIRAEDGDDASNDVLDHDEDGSCGVDD